MTGRAQIYFRHANDTEDERPAVITLNGVESDTLFFADTHSWDNWFTYSYTPLLRAGPNRIRLTTLTGRGGPNVDWLESTMTARTLEYQAEDATVAQGTVESRHRGFTGRGYVNPANVAGGYVEWTVTVDGAGFYNVGWVFANATGQDRTTTLTINGTVENPEWLFRGVSGSWSVWQEAGATMRLAAGTNTIRLTANTADGGPNYDALLLDLPL